MAKRKPYEAFVSPPGEAVFPYIITPDTRFHTDGVYVTDIAYTPAECEEFVSKLEGSLEKFFKEELNTTQQKTLARKPVFKEELTRPDFPQDATDEEREEIKANHIPEPTGRYLFRFKMKAKFQDRKGNVIEQQPIVVSADTGERVTENVWNGSVLRVKGQIVPYVNAAAQIAGLSLRMKSVQVIELVSGGEGGAGFWTDFDNEGDDE